jgi:hypothetical protein
MRKVGFDWHMGSDSVGASLPGSPMMSEAQAFGSFALPEKSMWGFVARARPVDASHSVGADAGRLW